MLVHRLVDLLGKMDHFEATCQGNLKGDTIDLASRAAKFLSYLAAWRYFGMSLGWLGCLVSVCRCVDVLVCRCVDGDDVGGEVGLQHARPLSWVGGYICIFTNIYIHV